MMSVLDCRWWFAGIIGELNRGVGLAMLMLVVDDFAVGGG